MTTLADASVLQSWLGPAFAVAISTPKLVDSQLFPEERAYIAGAIRKRREEFGTVRVCARRALADLGANPEALVPYADRSPRWPKGIIGSLAHCQDLCVAAVTSAPHILGLGVDVETSAALEVEIEGLICTEGERRFVNSHSICERGQIRKMIFCAKEALYKCQYPLTKTFIGFQDVEIDLDASLKTFVIANAPHHREIFLLLQSVKGQILLTDSLIFTAASLVGDQFSIEAERRMTQ